MSADNGTYVGIFPRYSSLAESLKHEGSERLEYRICVNGSDSVIRDLESYHYSPEQYRETIIDYFGGAIFTNHDKALLEAHRLDDLYREEDEMFGMGTEYGVVEVNFSVPYGKLRAEIPEPELPEGACKFCSILGHSETYHGGGTMCDLDPENPLKIAIDALREAGSRGWINEHFIARKIVDALKEKGKL